MVFQTEPIDGQACSITDKDLLFPIAEIVHYTKKVSF